MGGYDLRVKEQKLAHSPALEEQTSFNICGPDTRSQDGGLPRDTLFSHMTEPSQLDMVWVPQWEVTAYQPVGGCLCACIPARLCAEH